MISFFAWNTRGFNQSRKHDIVRGWIRAVQVSFGSFIETRVQESHSESILQSLLPGWSYTTNYDHHRLGRIWVVWSDAVEIIPIIKSAQHITCSVRIVNSGATFLCTFVYVSNFSAERRALWGDLCHIRSTLLTASTPWIVVGDFNEVFALSDHSRATDYSSNTAGMRDFQNTVSYCDISDLSSSGPAFTWINNQDVNPIGKKLDRALINSAWLSQFPYSHVCYEAGGISDHSRCVIHLASINTGHRKPFKFYNFMITHPSFMSIVQQVWEETNPLFHSRVALSLFHQKLND